MLVMMRGKDMVALTNHLAVEDYHLVEGNDDDSNLFRAIFGSAWYIKPGNEFG